MKYINTGGIIMYTCCDINNPFKTREGERIVDLDRYIKMLKENGVSFTEEQYKEAKKNMNKQLQ